MLFISRSLGHTYRIVVRDVQIMDLSSRQVIQLVVCHFSYRFCGLAKRSRLSLMTYMNMTSRCYKCDSILTVNVYVCLCAKDIKAFFTSSTDIYRLLVISAVFTVTHFTNESLSLPALFLFFSFEHNAQIKVRKGRIENKSH